MNKVNIRREVKNSCGGEKAHKSFFAKPTGSKCPFGIQERDCLELLTHFEAVGLFLHQSECDRNAES